MIDFLRHSAAHIFPVSLDESVVVRGDESHHLSRVLRVAIGDHVSAACEGSVRNYVITSISHDEIHLTAEGPVFEMPEPRIELFVSIFKIDRLEWGLAKAVETGATRIVVGATARSPLRINQEKSQKILRRFEAIAASAAQQSRRSSIPQCEYSTSLLSEFFTGDNVTRVVCEPGGDDVELTTPIRMLIGPEGGFDPQEYEQFSDVNKLSMGPHILRAETAMSFAPALVLSTMKV